MKVLIVIFATYFTFFFSSGHIMQTDATVDVFVHDSYTDVPLDSALVTIFHDDVIIDSVYTDEAGYAQVQITPTGVEETQPGIPSSFSVSENYPNPFQNETQVDFDVPEHQTIQAEVYNVLGQRVLTEELTLPAGYYTMNLSLAHLPAGAYFLRFTGQEQETVKLMKIGGDVLFDGGITGRGSMQVTARSGVTAGTVHKAMEDNDEFTIRVERDRYEQWVVTEELEAGMELNVPLERLNEVIFHARYNDRVDFEKELNIAGITVDDFRRTITTPDSMILKSGFYHVAGETDTTEVDDRIEIASVDTTLVLAVEIPVVDDGLIAEFVRNPPRVERAFIQRVDEREAEDNTRFIVEFERDERLEEHRRRVPIQFGREIIVLRDDGEGADERAGDGLYSAYIDIDVGALEEANRRIEMARQDFVPVYRGRERLTERRSQPFNVAGFREGELIDAVPPITLDIVFPDRSLFITDVDVVQDPHRTFDPCGEFFGGTNGNPEGTWTFAHLMTEMANETVTGIDPSEFVLQWLKSWTEEHEVGYDTVPERSLRMQSLILDRWIEASGGADEALDLSLAPFRLQAIVNRIDLRENLLFGFGSGGEGRFIFRALSIHRDDEGEVMSCTVAPMTIIFEYGIPKQSCEEVRDWGQQWYDLGQHIPGSDAYNAALESITEQFVSTGANPSKPNQSSLNQIRTNDAFVYEHPWANMWEMREFRLAEDTGYLVHQPLVQSVITPRPLGLSELVGEFIVEHAEEIVVNDYEVPLKYEGEPFLAGSARYRYTAFISPRNYEPVLVQNPRFGQPGEPEKLDPRHTFSLNNCTSCHAAETSNGFTHIKPREYGEESNLSGFMTGIEVTDPLLGGEEAIGSPRYFNELERRSKDLDMLVNSSCTIGLPPFELFFEPLRMAH